MKQNYRKPVLLICPDRDAGFGIVEAVIMAKTESSCYNMAFVKTSGRDASTSLTPLGKLGLAVKASHTHTLVSRHIHIHTSQGSEEETVQY